MENQLYKKPCESCREAGLEKKKQASHFRIRSSQHAYKSFKVTVAMRNPSKYHSQALMIDTVAFAITNSVFQTILGFVFRS